MVRRKPEPVAQNPELPGVPLRERGLEARVCYVTPKLAAQWLEKNVGNRNARPSRLATYGRDMVADNWSLTGEPIIFDRDGNLRNGQHRLLACVSTGAAFWTVVIWGVDPPAFRDMDRGASRTVADVLGIEGEANAVALASAAQLLYRDELGLTLTMSGGQRGNATAAESFDIIARHPELRDSLHVKNGARKLGLSPRLAIFAHYKLARVDKQMADEFFRQLYEGSGLPSGDPILVLRNQLTSERRDIKGNAQKQYAWIVQAWNHWRAGHNCKLIRWAGGKLPQPE